MAGPYSNYTLAMRRSPRDSLTTCRCGDDTAYASQLGLLVWLVLKLLLMAVMCHELLTISVLVKQGNVI
jgi:hypothetical protein